MRHAILLLMLLCSPIALMASTPDYQLTTLLESEVVNGRTDFGDLLFIRKPFIPDVFISGSTEPLEVQQHDILRWQGTSSRMSNPLGQESVLVNGSEYYFDVVGAYTIRSMLNQSNLAIITASPEDATTINISEVVLDAGFDLDFNQTSFVLGNEMVVPVALEVDDNIPAGLYSVSWNINEKRMNHSFRVMQHTNWTLNLTEFTKNITVKSGEGSYLGRMIVSNLGNQDVSISVTKQGNGTGMLSIPQKQTLFRKNEVNLDFQVQVPTIMKTGLYPLIITISGGNISRDVGLNITVIDSILPTIDSIAFASDHVFVPNQISVYATDNDEVKNLTVSYNGETFTMEKDGNLFTKAMEATKLSRYVFHFCASDPVGNTVCKEENKTFTQLSIINDSRKVLNMDSMRYGKYSRIKLFNLTKDLDEPISLELVSYDTIPRSNETVVFRIVDSEGSVKTYSQYSNEVFLSQAEAYYLEVRADAEMSVNGILRLNMPEQYEDIPDMTFRVEFKDYDVPLDFSKTWVDGRDVVCNVVDTGNLDTSYYDCMMQYPIDTRAEDISIPTTVKERNSFQAEVDSVRTLLIDTKQKTGLIIGVLVGIVVIIVLGSAFMLVYYPYMRFQMGKTERK